MTWDNAAALALAPFCSLFARHYSRTLYFAQFLFVLAPLFMTGSTTIISSYLGYSSLDFMGSFTTGWCDPTTFLCDYKKLISPAIVWLGVAVLFILIIKIVACKKREAKFLSFYNFYKGFMYWFFAPLIYAGVATIVPLIEADTIKKANFYAGVVTVLAFFVLALIELIAYKVAQREEENIWKKWI